MYTIYTKKIDKICEYVFESNAILKKTPLSIYNGIHRNDYLQIRIDSSVDIQIMFTVADLHLRNHIFSYTIRNRHDSVSRVFITDFPSRAFIDFPSVARTRVRSFTDIKDFPGLPFARH